MSDSIPLCVSVSKYAFNALAVCLESVMLKNESVANQTLSRWFCKIDRTFLDSTG